MNQNLLQKLLVKIRLMVLVGSLAVIFLPTAVQAERISLSGLKAEIEALQAELESLQQQLSDLQLTQGPQGEKGEDGLSCWDLNSNGIEDDFEDINTDGQWDTADCAGTGGDLDPVYDLINEVSDRLGMLETRLENVDADNDSFSPLQGDCDDSNAEVNPLITEIVGDGIDNDCDGTVDFLIDNDGDGFTVEDGDCDNFDATVYPGAPELSDGIDNDCDGTLDDEDRDGDGFSSIAGDCNDFDPQIFPGAPERPNNRDDDCDGTTQDEDHDFDGFTRAQDCDDRDSLVKPTQTGFFLDRSNGGTFDYNCNGSLERLYPTSGSCSQMSCNDGNPFTSDFTCYKITASGWRGSIPGCGGSGTWQTESSGGFRAGRCSEIGVNRRQSCR